METFPVVPVPGPPTPDARGCVELTCCGCAVTIGRGLLARLPETLAALGPGRRAVVVTDRVVEQLWGAQLIEAFARSGGTAPPILALPPGEENKTRETKSVIEDWLISNRCDRNTIVVAFGGGVIGDMVGFVAATYMRGVPFIQIPTSLLAMVDASVGGKTGVNAAATKNVVGAFHHPTRVLIDVDLLASLPQRHFANGMAEVIKMAAILDLPLFEQLEHAPAVAGDARLVAVVARAVQLKAILVDADPTEKGIRALLNFGHSIGHAIEALAEWRLLHGECVAIGMVLEAQLGELLGVTAPSTADRFARVLAAHSLPTALPAAVATARAVVGKMAADKKNTLGRKRVVMVRTTGQWAGVLVVADDVLEVVIAPAVTVPPTSTPLSGCVTVPGSKSVSNRALLLAALGRGSCKVRGLLRSEDTEAMLGCLTLLGVNCNEQLNGDIVVHGTNGKLTPPKSPLNVANAGTAARFLAAACTLIADNGRARLEGSARMHERPIGDLVDALRACGCAVDYEGADGCLPLSIQGTGLAGGDMEVVGDVSSQFVSALLMVAPHARTPVALHLRGTLVSEPYVALTVAVMRRFGVEVRVEDGVYHVPMGGYDNPESFLVEGDASSASYPLCMAAATGGQVSVENVGSTCTQGDAGFCHVLARMGCTVTQEAERTTVIGPSNGALQAIEIDLGSMTDCFLGLATLAAFAQGTTRITGIANQRVKECNRIAAVVEGLLALGVNAHELSDGLAIEGCAGDASRLRGGAIDPRHDHRVAMAFAVLAARVAGVHVTDKDCVAKTYPAFWLDMMRCLGLQVREAETKTLAPGPEDNVVLIGMRGAGKSTLGALLASSLGRALHDVDAAVEASAGMTIAELVARDGFPRFRELEAAALARLLRETRGGVIVCGGGIVETESNRTRLQRERLVVTITRDIRDIEATLSADASRPALPTPPAVTWEARRPLYLQCSSYELTIRPGDHDVRATAADLTALVRRALGQGARPHLRRTGPPTTFLSLTMPEVTPAATHICEGVDAVELRADLLADTTPANLAHQLAALRRHVALPVVLTVRTAAQGGRFAGTVAEARALLEVGLRAAVEYVDIEICWPIDDCMALARGKRSTCLIVSHHDPVGGATTLDALKSHARRCSLGGQADVVKVVFRALSTHDSILAHLLTTSGCVPQPILSVCMGEHGALSRALNRTMTPVTHPDLPTRAAPGQLSLAEVRELRRIAHLDVRDKLSFKLFGTPIGASVSPPLHNAGFRARGLPHVYDRCETADPLVVMREARADDFGGGSVTIPLKEQMVGLVDELTPRARAIGAVNTLLRRDSTLVGDNTDWIGVRDTLRPHLRGLPSAANSCAAVVLGAGGTARAAVYALQQLGLAVVVVNRTVARAEALARDFAPASALADTSEPALTTALGGRRLVAVVSTLPPGAVSDVALLLTEAMAVARPAVLDAAYRPRETPLLARARALGCVTVSGLEMLIAQGLAQWELWTQEAAPAETMREAATAAYAALPM